MSGSFSDYPPEMPTRINASQYPSVLHMLDESLERFADNAAFASFDTTVSFDDLNRWSGALAAYLQAKLGVKKGDRVAIMAPNILQYPVAVLAIIRCGGIVVNVNPAYTARELEHQLNDAEVQTILVFSGSVPTLESVIPNTSVAHVIVTWLNDLLEADATTQDVEAYSFDCVPFLSAIDAGSHLPFTRVELEPDDVLLLQYTGGTTGVSKGAALTHRNLVANILQYETWYSGKLTPGSDIILTALPLYHIFALMVNCLSSIRLGMLSVLVTDPRDISSVVEVFRKWRVTTVTGVNTLFNGLVHAPGFSEIDFELKLCIGGGAAIQRVVAESWHAMTGCHILEAYGLSETSPALTANRTDVEGFTGTIGLALPSTEISLRDDSGKEVSVGEQGELCVRGPQVMPGYWRNDAATADCMTRDGYFRTGDIATVDEAGYFRIVDRKKDMILVSGFNVFPNEIEDVVSRCPGVVEVACIGVPDAKSGEAVRVYVVRGVGTSLSGDDVTGYCRSELTAYKVPKQVVFTDAIPKSNVGKILRRVLREQSLNE